MPRAYERRTRLPAILAGAIPPPYELRVEQRDQEDLGYLAELYREGEHVKAVELYPYTVQGPGRARPPDERRIQLELARRDRGIERKPPVGRTGIMFGYRTHHPDGSPATPLAVCLAFGTWRGVTARNSIQFPRRLLDEAELFGASAFAKVSTALGYPSRAILLAIRVEAFPFFMIELADDFAAPQDWDPASVRRVEDAGRRYFSARPMYERPVATDKEAAERDRVRREVTRPIRDGRFSANVLRAYGHSCAVCGIQLELVEAAHINPVENPLSTDDVNNGIALCALHHLAYDTGLLQIEANGNLHLDDARVAELRRRSRAGGLDAFRAALPSSARLPVDDSLRPHPENIRVRVSFLRRERS